MKKRKIADETQAIACRAVCLDLTTKPGEISQRFSVEQGHNDIC